jgi:uncharacterized protein
MIMSNRIVVAVLALAVIVGGMVLQVAMVRAADAPAVPAFDAGGGSGKIRTLLLTGGAIHDAKGIGDIVQEMLKKTERFEVTRVHEDLDGLLAERIAPYDLVVFYWTIGEIKEAQKRGLMNHIAAGKGFVTFHSGADSFRGDPDYQAFVGGHFIGHPHYRPYQVSITPVDSPITKGIEEFMITDEQYILDYSSQMKVLANALHKGATMPVMWTKDWGKGRIFYSALGHDPKACKQEMFQRTLLRGALWAAGREVKE